MTLSGPSSRRLFEHEIEERLDAVLFASPSHRSVAGLARQLEDLARTDQERVLRWVGIAAQTYAEIGYLIASIAPQALSRLDADGFDAWVIAGLDAYDRDGLRPAMAVLRDIGGFAAQRGRASGTALTEVESRLTRFIQGLSGRPLSIKTANMAWTDTEVLYLPARLAAGKCVDSSRRLYMAMAAQLWAQTRYGTFDADIDAAIAVYPDRGRALEWLALLEAVRLEARIAADLPGLAAEMAALRGPWPEVIESVRTRLVDLTARVENSLELLGALIEAVPPRLPWTIALDPTAARRLRAERIARETHILRKALGALKAGGGRKQGGEAVLDVAAGEDGVLEVRVDGELIALPAEAQAAAQSLVQDLGQLPPEVLCPAGPGGWLPTDKEGAGTELVSDREPDWCYDEWDYHRSAYRKGWCHVYEVDVPAGDAAYVEEVRSRYHSLIVQLRRRFEAVRGEDRRLGRQPDGDEIDLDAQVDAHIDRRSGLDPSARLFSRRIRSERSFAALFMVDMSGSTKGWVNDAEREALIMLCEAIEALGDDYAIYGFSGWTRTHCDIYRIKAFGERYGGTVRARIAGIEAKDYTRMGVAIRHLTKLLAARPVRHKLLVTLSDGRPDDFGDEYRGNYGIEDTRRAFQEARREGIHGYCVTIDRHAADYLRHMVGPSGFTVLDDARKLPLRIADIYRRLTAA